MENMKKLILKTAVIAALSVSTGVQAYSISQSVVDDRDILDLDAGVLNGPFTMDGGKFYRLTHDGNGGRETHGTISAFDRNGITRVDGFSSQKNLGSTVGSHKGFIIKKDDEIISIYDTNVAAGQPVTVTSFAIDASSIAPGDGITASAIAKADDAVALDSDTGTVYFTGPGNVDGNIYKYDISTKQTSLFSEYREVEPETNGREVSIFAKDMEFVDGALWVLQGKDNDLHKISADGTYLGRDKTIGQPDNTSQFRLEGLGFDETTGEFWATAYFTPNDGGDEGYYYVSLTDIGLDTPSANTPATDLAVIDTFFDWAESKYPQYLSSHSTSQEILGYYARHYPAKNIYLGTREGRLYVYGETFGGLLDLGDLQGWLELSTE